MKTRWSFQVTSWICLFTLVISEFTCPDMASNCSCGVGPGWLDGSWVTDLTFLNCSGRYLSEIPDFKPFKGEFVHQLLLNNNNISYIHKKDFRHIKAREIILSKNPIKVIAKDAFSHVSDHLEKLDLSNDKIQIDDGLPYLEGLNNLKTLDLGYNTLENKFKVFPSNLFSSLNLSSLTTLTLQALQMSKLGVDTFTGIDGLEQLDLSFNFLYQFPPELLKLKNLKGLKLYSNEILILKNYTFSGLNNLQKLLLGVNDMDTIEVNAFSDLEDSIEEINLYHNPLSRVPTEAIERLRNLKRLSLVKTNLKNVENGSFVGEYAIEELHLDDNPRLEFVDGMFHGIEDSLNTLFIRELDLETLPLNVLDKLVNLRYLDATDNKIQKIDKHFFDGLNLTSISLMWNKIKHVDHKAFRHFEKGVTLNLHKNLIHDISFILRVKKCTFEKVYVTKNKIKCDCKVEEVLNSGLVKWEILGECYVDSQDGYTRWYSFDDPALMDYLWTKCNRTRPYATCMPYASMATRAGQSAYSFLMIFMTYIITCFKMPSL